MVLLKVTPLSSNELRSTWTIQFTREEVPLPQWDYEKIWTSNLASRKKGNFNARPKLISFSCPCTQSAPSGRLRMAKSRWTAGRSRTSSPHDSWLTLSGRVIATLSLAARSSPKHPRSHRSASKLRALPGWRRTGTYYSPDSFVISHKLPARDTITLNASQAELAPV